MYKFLEVVFLLCCLYSQSKVEAHGRLVTPPGRSTMWRYGYSTPIDYNDNQLFCGGKSVQWDTHDGKCGVCGDPYDENPRSHEAGGKYVSDVLAGYYTKGSTINVSVQITANHKGWFEFRLCKNDNFSKTFTHDCLDEHLLPLAAFPLNTRHHINDDTGFKNFTLQLPGDLTCSQCVLQWKYNTGNSWGVDETGFGCLGCGEQEQFYGCSDIAISDPLTTSSSPLSTTLNATTTAGTTTDQSTGSSTSNLTAKSTILSTILRSSTPISESTTSKPTSESMVLSTNFRSSTPISESTTSKPTSESTVLSTILRSSTPISESTTSKPTSESTVLSTNLRSSTPISESTTSKPTATTTTTTTTTQQPTTTRAEETSTSTTTTTTSGGPQCKGIAPYNPTDEWCDTNCNHNPPYCPASHCSCS